MELMVSYFWLIKLSISVLVLACGYLGFKEYQKKRKVINMFSILFFVGVLLLTFNPVKMDVNTKAVTSYANTQIEQGKVLPPKVVDDTFNSKVISVEGISEEDMR